MPKKNKDEAEWLDDEATSAPGKRALMFSNKLAVDNSVASCFKSLFPNKS